MEDRACPGRYIQITKANAELRHLTFENDGGVLQGVAEAAEFPNRPHTVFPEVPDAQYL